MSNTQGIRTTLLFAAAGMCLATGSALAQAYSGGPNESVIVEAPRLRAETTPLNGPPGRAWLSMNVRYDDINLLTRSGARAFRWRVWRAANEVCDRLADAYPVQELTSAKPCVRTAYENGMVRAYGAISDARVSYRLGY